MDKVTFQVNGVRQAVGCEVSSTTTLLQYLRRTLELRGTKYMCLEGGCGACIVSAVKCHGDHPRGVNSCMVSITSCQDWVIETIDYIGNRLKGYHPLQTTLAKENGSQCGYCSPGMIMNIYSLLQEKRVTMFEIEKSLGSNVCRCTGYVPILRAFKKFASDAPNPLLDIEDLKICDKSEKACFNQSCDAFDWCIISKNEVRNEIAYIKLKDNRHWYRPDTLSEVFNIWEQHGVMSYMLVAGNTAKGVYPILEYPILLIDISDLIELKGFYIDQNLILGGGTSLSDVINIFTELGNNDDFSYLNILKDHLELVAHVVIRNLATIAGNLMIKNQHPDFKSDIFILLEMVDAQVTIMSNVGQQHVLSMQDFLKENMTGKILLNVILPPLSFEHKMVSYKIMPRAQNAHAIVHAGFNYRIDANSTVLECRIVYGGLSPQFIRASYTEYYLKGKNLFANETLQGALEILNSEMVVVEELPDPPVENRRQIALGLFYKGLLSLCPPNIVDVRYMSGAFKLRDTRPVSDGYEIYDTNPTLWPLNKPIPKLEGLIQCAGEAKYSEDIPSLPGEVFAAFVTAKVPSGTIKMIDPSNALSQPGVIAFYSASDIPGENSYIPVPIVLNTTNEELFCNGEVKYFDQPLGVIVAECQDIANKAATMVHVEYTTVRRPVIDIKEAKNDLARVSLYSTADATKRGNEIVKIIRGEDTIYAQYHFSMETLVAIVYPTEEGLKIFAATQWPDLVQRSTSRLLNLDQSRIDVYVRRLGGAYGLKVSRASQIALSAALVSYKLNRPCRFINPLTANMRSVGKRMPCSRDFEGMRDFGSICSELIFWRALVLILRKLRYSFQLYSVRDHSFDPDAFYSLQVAVNAEGVIQYVDYKLYDDNGYIFNEPLIALVLDEYYNCYRKDTWQFAAYNAVTDTASNTWCRSPGTLEGIVMAEILMERIAYEINRDPLEVRLANLDTEKHGDIQKMTETLKNNANYAERRIKVDIFNKHNRWKKRGLRFSYLRWTPVGFQNFEVNLSVFVDDGTVVITHGGIEMGQGVNTKAIQICAYILKIPVEKIQVKPNDTVIAPNCTGSGGSVTSQNVGIGVRRCCEKLLERLEPVRLQLDNPSWVELIRRAFDMQVDLQVHDYTTSNDIQDYDIYGVTLAEVEIDVLTGEWQIIQVDLMEDVGQSVNPELDVGQVQGAFTMGVGYSTCENFVYDANNGELLTDRTWEYWVPQAMDIPQNFRIYFNRRSYSKEIIFGAKGTGEPATCMGVVVTFAMREAIAAARLDSGIPTTQWFQIDGPFTVDKICVSTASKWDEFKFY